MFWNIVGAIGWILLALGYVLHEIIIERKFGTLTKALAALEGEVDFHVPDLHNDVRALDERITFVEGKLGVWATPMPAFGKSIFADVELPSEEQMDRMVANGADDLTGHKQEVYGQTTVVKTAETVEAFVPPLEDK